MRVEGVLIRYLLAIVLSLMASLAVTASASAGQVETFPLPSDLVNPQEEPGFNNPARPSDLNVNVLLPDGYDSQSVEAKEGYPVLYLLHGANGYHRTWTNEMDLEEVTAGFPGIIVLPDGGVYGMYSDWYNEGAYGRPQWMQYHLNTLVDAVEQKYPIREGRRWHAIAGVSMGGMGAVRYASAKPGYFGSVAAFSAAALDLDRPEIPFAMTLTGAAVGEGATFEDIWGPADGFYAKANNPQELIPNLTNSRVFITSGDGTLCPGDPLDTNPGDLVLESVLRMHATDYVAAAEQLGVDVTEERTCGGHTYPTSVRALQRAMLWGFFGEVPEDPHSWTYLTASQHGDANGVRFDFESQPTTDIHFERSENTLRGKGEGMVRIRFGESCDLNLTLPFEIPMECKVDTPPDPEPKAKRASLKLSRQGKFLRLRSNGPVVSNVKVKLYRLQAKPKRKLISTKKVAKVGAKTLRLRIKIKSGSRYLAVASGKQGGRAVQKTLRFRTTR